MAITAIPLCPHLAEQTLRRFAPCPCGECGGWIDREGRIMGFDETVRRFPFMRGVIEQDPLPPDGGPVVESEPGVSRGDVLAGALGQLVGASVGIAVALVALALLVAFVVHLAGWV